MKGEGEAVGYLLSARAVRERAHEALALAQAGELEFTIDESRFGAVVDRVLATTRAHYPDLARIPPHSRWRHFDVGGVDRAALLDARLAGASVGDALAARFDLAVTSVLLDAGAGPAWRYVEPGTGLTFTRSEGLAVASFHLFMAGGLSSDPARPLRADAQGLQTLDEAALARAFQVTEGNPLVGLGGRAALLQRLGAVMAQGPHLADVLRARGAELPASKILAAVLARLGPIWPGRQAIAGVNLGDTWVHPRLGLVPLHKLSQWLSYSLLEPLAAAGVTVTDLDALTGLAEYRNGGLFLDAGLLRPKRPEIFAERHDVGSPLVIEWRTLTVALLDRVAAELRARLGVDATSLPLAKVLEGGTWRAGREIAAEKRPGGGPPLAIVSDGTVF